MTRKKVKAFILFIGDVIIIFPSLYLTLLIRNSNLTVNFNNFLHDFFIVYLSWFGIIFFLNLYESNFLKKVPDFIFNIVIFSFVALFLGMAYFYFRPVFSFTPKTILLLNVIIFDILFFIWRYSFDFVAHIEGIKERMVIIGFKSELSEVADQIKKYYEIVGLFCPLYLNEKNICQSIASETQTFSDIKELVNLVDEKKVSTILIVEKNKELVREVFSNLPLTINYVDFKDLYEFAAKKVSLKNLDEAWFLEKISKPDNKFEEVIKRLFDLLFSSIGLIFFAIFYPFIALAVKSDSKGKVLFSQERPGKNGKNFTIYKFRTLTENPGDNSPWREKNQNNITKPGKFLRKSHLDELPQAWSIFKGDMTFVGPRPEPLEHAKIFEKEIPFYKQRYLVKPGLIGWAQINFPASQSVNQALEKFEYDLYYIKNRSVLLDLEIILKAIKLFFF